MKHIDELIEKKKNNEAIFLGCGPSINDLQSEDWDKIKNLDIIKINRII